MRELTQHSIGNEIGKDWRKTESGKVVGAGQWKKKKTFHSPLDCRLDMTKFSVALSGLAPSVTKEDLEELFSPIVSGKRPFWVKMHYNESRRPMGSAEITFPSFQAAKKAVATYDKVPLDNYPMKLRLNDEELMPKKEKIPVFYRISKQRRQQDQPSTSVEQLDQEMEEYMSNK